MDFVPRQPARRAGRAWQVGQLSLFLTFFLLLQAVPSLACRAMPSPPTEFPDIARLDGGYTAFYEMPTQRYPHGVLGDTIEAGGMRVISPKTSGACGMVLELPHELVFEDLVPRFFDITKDGVPEVVTIRSHRKKGAQVAVYKIIEDELHLLTQTPFIGTANRWLAIIGVGDLNGDGKVEIAYIDRPHLAKTLRVWQYDAGKLKQIANLRGLTNHRIGQDFITGGIRTCNKRPEMITVDSNWKNIMTTYFEDSELVSKIDRWYGGSGSIAEALNCR